MHPSPLEAVLLGAGNRGHSVYGAWALEHPEHLKFSAVAEPDPARRERFAQAHGIVPERCFSSWEELLAQPQLAPALVNALPDRQHEQSAVSALERGYHQLLEKPMAHTLEGGVRIAHAAQASGRVLMLGYVLRFTPFFQAVKRLLEAGELGEVVSVLWRENVSSLHYAHSYVRGNWARLETSSPFVLAKCSHDLDLLGWLLGRRVARLSSFGGLLHFRPEHAPEGAPERCLDGCPAEDTCPFHVRHAYLTETTGWPASVISTDPSLEGRKRALETGPYGRCVYRAGNDVVDHQVVAFELEPSSGPNRFGPRCQDGQSGASGTLTLHGHSGEEGRTLRLDGTKATLHGRFSASTQELRLERHDARTAFSGQSEAVFSLEKSGMAGGGHGGGDAGLCAAFVAAVRSGQPQPLEDYLESQILAFACEEARHTGGVLELAGFRARALSGRSS